MKFALCVLVCLAAGCAGGVTQIKRLDVKEVTMVSRGSQPVSICVKKDKAAVEQTCYELDRPLLAPKYTGRR